MSGDPRKRESGRRSPTHPLNEAVGFLQSIQANLGDTRSNRSSLATALGHKSASGPLSMKIGSLTHFGLLDRDKGAYRISSVGKSILFPCTEQEKQDALVGAATTPTLYRQLVDDYAGNSLPNLFNHVLSRNYGVASGSSDDVVRVFTQTMEFVGLLRNGVLQSSIPINKSFADADNDSDLNEIQPQDVEADHSSSSVALSHFEVDNFSIPLAGGRTAVLRIPRPIGENDFNRLKGWLDLMKDVLIEEPGISGN